MPTDWGQCELVEEVSIACLKGTRVPAYFVVAACVGVHTGYVLSDADKTVVDQIADYTRDRELDDDWSECDAVENKPLVCIKGTDLPVYFAMYDPLSEMVEGKVDDDTLEKIMTYDADHFGDEPVWTDQTITITLDTDDVDITYRSLSSMDNSEILENLGVDGETVGPLTITVTHRDAEIIRSSIEHIGQVMGSDYDLPRYIAVMLYVNGIDPRPTL